MGFLWVTLHVKNMDSSIWFYKNIVGLNISSRFKVGETTEITFLKSDGSDTQVELIFNEGIDKYDCGSDYSLGFEVKSADKMMDIIKTKNIKIVSSMLQPKPDIKFFYVLDPDGRKVQFVENISL